MTMNTATQGTTRILPHVYVSVTDVHLDFWDRVKLLFVGKFRLRVRTRSENPVGSHEATSEFSIPGRTDG